MSNIEISHRSWLIIIIIRVGSDIESGAFYSDSKYKTSPMERNSNGDLLPFEMYDRRLISHQGYKFGIDFQNARIDCTNDASSCESYPPNVDSHRTQFVLDRRKGENYCSIQDATIFHNKSEHGTNIPIWSIDCKENVVLLGCVDGCLEFWDCISGKLKVGIRMVYNSE